MTAARATKSTWRNGGLWALFPVAILAPLVGGQLYLVHRALSDPSFAVEDRYYAKAVSWDTGVAERKASERLGWRAHGNVRVAPGRQASASLELTDREGLPVTGAHVEAEAFAVARSGRVVHATLPETKPGAYEGALAADRPGLWELSFQVTRGADRFTSVVRVDVPARQAPRDLRGAP